MRLAIDRSRRLGINDEGADSAGPSLNHRHEARPGWSREDTVEVGDPAIGDPRLLTIQHVTYSAFPAGAAFDRSNVRASVGLRKRERGDCVAGGDARQVSMFDLV